MSRTERHRDGEEVKEEEEEDGIGDWDGMEVDIRGLDGIFLSFS